MSSFQNAPSEAYLYIETDERQLHNPGCAKKLLARAAVSSCDQHMLARLALKMMSRAGGRGDDAWSSSLAQIME